MSHPITKSGFGEHDPAIRFFADGLGFELVEDSPALTHDGPPKRWVVVRPPGAATGVLLARVDGDAQAGIAGKQAAGRVGFFLHVSSAPRHKTPSSHLQLGMGSRRNAVRKAAEL